MNPESCNAVPALSSKASVLMKASALLKAAMVAVPALLLSSLVPSAFAHDLKDVALVAGPGQTYLKVTFSGTPSEGEYPLYFQKTDLTRGTITLSFLETETAFPLGRHALDSGSPALEEIQIRKMTSPSGKTFLGLELKLKEPPMSEALVQPIPKGGLKLVLNNGEKKKFTWTLSKALKAREDYLAAKAAVPANAPSKAYAEQKAKALGEPVSAEPSQPAENPKAQGVGTEAQAPKADSKAMKAALHGKIKIESAEASAPAAAAKAGSEPSEGVKSALDEGAALEASHGAKPLSSSKVFSVGTGSKPMILTKDSAAMKDKPGAAGKTLKKIPVGEKVERLEGKSGWMRVAAGPDTGYIRAGDAVYADEITPAQEKSIKDKVDSKAAKLAAAEAKAAAAEAKKQAAEAKAAAAAAAKIAAAESKKQAAEAKLAAKAEEAKKKADQKLADAAAAAQAKQQKADMKLAEAGSAKSKAKAVPVSDVHPQPVDPAAGNAPIAGNASGLAPKLAIADNPELADKLAKEKKAAEEEKMRVEPEENRVTYNSYGRRDPFIPVEQGSTDNGIDIDQMKVVGIIWQSSEPMAVLEHTREANVSFTVKQGDPVHNGKVARITREGVTFDISEYGISRSYSLKLVSSKEGTKK